jgi:hypothetical protein
MVTLGDTCQVYFFFPLCCALFHTFISERDCTPLQCFYKGCIQSNQKLALSRLMHSIHCGSAVFPYEALERRSAQGTLTGCAGLHNKIIRSHWTLILHDEVLCDFSLCNIIWIVTCNRPRWTGRVARTGKSKNTRGILAVKSFWKRPRDT